MGYRTRGVVWLAKPVAVLWLTGCGGGAPAPINPQPPLPQPPVVQLPAIPQPPAIPQLPAIPQPPVIPDVPKPLDLPKAPTERPPLASLLLTPLGWAKEVGQPVELTEAPLEKLKVAGTVRRVRVAEKWKVVDAEWQPVAGGKEYLSCTIRVTTAEGEVAANVRKADLSAELLLASGRRTAVEVDEHPTFQGRPDAGKDGVPPIPPIKVVTPGSYDFYFSAGTDEVSGVEVKLGDAKRLLGTVTNKPQR